MRPHSIFVLNKEADGLQADVAPGIAIQLFPFLDVARCEVFERVEIYTAAAFRRSKIIYCSVTEIAAKPDRMFSVRHGSRIREIECAARRGFQRPSGISAHRIVEARAEADARKSEKRRVL